jgi:site-specific DNA-methyltransferase (adenine-specific)
MYGSGFPKSLDVSKAIDKAAGVEREVIETIPDRWAGKGNVLNRSREDERDEVNLTAPATLAAQKWQGWGTALKPAFEPIILARKPLTGTVAANVQEFGTGALNIDGGRVKVDPNDPVNTAVWIARDGQNPDRPQGFLTGSVQDGDRNEAKPPPGGRWPANVILDPEAGAMLDAQSGAAGAQGPASGPTYSGPSKSGSMAGAFGGMGDAPPVFYSDTGGASRFFYCAKASRAERNAGLDGFEERPASDRYKTISTLNAANQQRLPAANVHPTVKPIDLMRYLVRLVTPPGGTVLDPFTGSGTTGVAAGLEGFDFIGIEREAEYREIAEARLNWWGDQAGETDEILRRAGLAEKKEREAKESGQASLFDEEAA